MLSELCLDRDIFKYNYLFNAKAIEIEQEIQERMSGEDAANFNEIQEAFDVCDFKQEDRKDLFKIISSILNLGNLKFAPVDEIFSKVDETSSANFLENFSNVTLHFFSLFSSASFNY